MSEDMESKTFKGETVSTGVGMGKVFIIEDIGIKIREGIIEQSEVDNQVTVLEVAICKTYIQIHDLKIGLKGILSDEENRIFDFYKAILDDRSFFEEMKNTIKTKRFYVEKAIYTCVQQYMDEISKSSNEYAKQRLYDLNDVRTRLIRNVFDESEINLDALDNSHIAVIREMTPIIAALVSKKGVKAVVAEKGAGYYSHASIVLRSMGIPALNGIEYDKLKLYRGEFAAVYSDEKVMVINPKDTEIMDYRPNSGLNVYIDSKEQYEKRNSPAVTTDGYRVGLSANISSINEFRVAKKMNIDGIGLVRTESLFINYRKIPGEKRQFLIYSSIVRGMEGRPVVIRTLDIGGDKAPGTLGLNAQSIRESLRGIRRSLEKKNELIVQIRSILRASEFGNVSITFPMVNSAKEINEVKSIIYSISEEMYGKKETVPVTFKIGSLIETVSAVEDLDNILKEIDFISIGTNDLLHQVCGFSRKCSTIEKNSYFEPEFLRTLKLCIDKSLEHGKEVSVCGEMASEPVAVPVLVGMGVNDLSMSPATYESIKKVIRELSFKEAKELAEKLLKCASIEEIIQIMSL
jgi:phosphotransferase system enzyme I (PtsI)